MVAPKKPHNLVRNNQAGSNESAKSVAKIASAKEYPSEHDADRAWKIAQLAATLVSNMDLKGHGPGGMKVNARLSTKEPDPFFAAALKRADSLLSCAEGNGVVYAYHIFEEGDRQTEKCMADTFKKWEWKDL